jgi:hypothetical protein
MPEDLLINKSDQFFDYINDIVYLIEKKREIIKRNSMIMNKEIIVDDIHLYMNRIFVDDDKTK